MPGSSYGSKYYYQRYLLTWPTTLSSAVCSMANTGSVSLTSPPLVLLHNIYPPALVGIPACPPCPRNRTVFTSQECGRPPGTSFDAHAPPFSLKISGRRDFRNNTHSLDSARLQLHTRQHMSCQQKTTLAKYLGATKGSMHGVTDAGNIRVDCY
jgi:hypothetical protein